MRFYDTKGKHKMKPSKNFLAPVLVVAAVTGAAVALGITYWIRVLLGS